MQIAALVCENGLGHFKRTLGLLDYWHRQYPEDELHLFAEQWQAERLYDWPKIKLLYSRNVFFHPGFMAPGVRLIDPVDYSDGRLLKWEERLRKNEILNEADLVICDNLVGILDLRPDAILQGSFLWSDILEKTAKDDPDVTTFIDHERVLLEKFKPPMICVESIAMPGVQSRTQPVMVPWFGQEKSISRDPAVRHNRVAILGGATGLVDDQILELAETLEERSGLKIFLPGALAKRSEGRFEAFGFGLEDFAKVDVVICRPGVGTITDCISTQTPMITFSETGNPEMDFNATRLEELGIAMIANRPEEVMITLENLMKPTEYCGFVERLSACPTNGFEIAARWIKSQMS